uniref:Surface antigen BspA n=1 Tax=uncultured bacterium 34R1 TaxID=581113 RepID=C0K048_9BACT|nr:surface antigen BspA [uncultured bacterium 34R1]
MRKLQFLFIFALCALGMQGVEVETTAGGLLSKVTDLNITSLTVTGSLDARDFMFISRKLDKLTTVDLSAATIVEYDGVREPLVNGQILFPANEIPQLSFFGKKLTSVVLPSSLKSIGMAAFSGCRDLKSITFPSKLTTIGSYAFNGSGLENLTVPSSVTLIGKGAFSRCEQLTKLISRAAVIDNYAFLGCTKLEDVTIEGALQQVGISAFNGCQALTTIAFRNATKVQLIGAEAFVLSGLQTFDMKKMAALTEIGDYAFLNLKDIESLTIPANVSFIGTRAMMGMTGLTKIYAKPETPPALGEAVWEGVDQKSVELLVNVDDYRSAEQWKEFLIYDAILLGDVNGDGRVNVSDITALINRILGIPDTFIEKAGDVLADGRINVSDVAALINIILAGDEIVIHNAAAVNTDDFVSIDNFTIAPDEVKTIDIKLSNQTDYAAMQFDLMLPDGLTVVNKSVTATSRSAEHSIISMDKANAYRIIAYSMENNVFNGNEGPVLRIKVKATEELAPDAQITIDNVIFATEKSSTFYAAATNTQVSNTTTAVDDILAANDRVYTRGGMLVIETTEAGVAQLVQMNGMVQDLQVAEGHNEFEVTSGFVIVRLNGKSYKLAVK